MISRLEMNEGVRLHENSCGRAPSFNQSAEQRWHRITTEIVEDIDALPRELTLSIQDSILTQKFNELRGTGGSIRRARMVSLCALLLDGIEQLDFEDLERGGRHAHRMGEGASVSTAVDSIAPPSFRTLHHSDAVLGDEVVHYSEDVET